MQETSYQYNQFDLSRLLHELHANPPKEIDLESMGGKNSIVTKYMLARAGLLHRALELAISADKSIENRQMVSSSLLIRALFETVSVFGYMYNKIIDFNKSKDIKQFNDDITKVLYGTRDGSTDYVSINILSMIDKIDKEYPNYRTTYNRLSEYAHPNFTGASLLYSNLQKDTQDTRVEYNDISSDDMIHKNINDLCLCIDRLKYFILQTSEIIEELVIIEDNLNENKEEE
jgi:hypothetical protein